MKCRLILSFIILVAFLILVSGCSESPSIFRDQELTLHVDAEVTETWITLSINPLKGDATYIVQRDTTIVFEGRLQSADTLLHDTGLEPATTYSYTAWARKGGDSSERSSLTVTTMDTTSHDFEWQIYEFGGDGAGSSVLYDVAIINENDIWAVGEIHTADTDRWNEDSTQWIPPYNAVHWDGNEWELIRIKTEGCGGVVYPPIKTVFTFAEDEILFAHIDGSITFYDGNTFRNDCSLITQLNGSARKIWGMSSKYFYVVSGNGFIAHYDGNYWRRVESGTGLDIRDIHGDYNPETGEYEVLAVASNIAKDKEIRFLRINDMHVEELPLHGLTYFLDGIWFKANSQYFIIGSGVFENDRMYQSKPWYDYPRGLISSFHIHDVDANDINDVVTAGSFGEILHFNGATWKNYYSRMQFSGFYNGVDIEENMVAFAGLDSQAAYVLIGKR